MSRQYHPASDEEGRGLLQDSEQTHDDRHIGASDDLQGVAASTQRPKTTLFVRVIALACACSLSIGSHYATNMLGPLKSRLSREMGTSNTEFSLLIAAFSLNSTWTPLLGGVLASKLGSTFTSILATGVIFLGQALLLIGNLYGSVRLMVFGMFVFGLGVSPLSVIQEAIIVRFFRSHGLGVSMAFGLVAGKGASFVSARISYPLSERYGPHAPFYVATALAAFSVVMNVVYISVSKWLVRSTGVELEASELADEARKRAGQDLSEAQALEEVAKKHRVDLHDITKLGDVFWAYIALNFFCGTIWGPFNHLSANIFQTRYGLSESDAGTKASYLLAGSVILYPVVGWFVDNVKKRNFIIRMLTLSSCLTFICYSWLSLPPSWTRTPMPAITMFGTALGFSPLLLVVLVPQLVPLKYVPTTLGAHKAIEKVGESIFQTIAGLTLDVTHKKKTSFAPSDKDMKSSQTLLQTFAFLNLIHLCFALGLSYLQRRRTLLLEREESVPLPRSRPNSRFIEEIPDTAQIERAELAEQQRPLLEQRQISYSPPPSIVPASTRLPDSKTAEARRGRVFAGISLGLLGLAWVLFLGTAVMKLRSKAERVGSP